MPLAINDTETLFGTQGRRGTDGDDAFIAGAGNGVGGTNGRPGAAAAIERGATTLIGDAGDDSVVMTLTAQGGSGGGARPSRTASSTTAATAMAAPAAGAAARASAASSSARSSSTCWPRRAATISW